MEHFYLFASLFFTLGPGVSTGSALYILDLSGTNWQDVTTWAQNRIDGLSNQLAVDLTRLRQKHEHLEEQFYGLPIGFGGNPCRFMAFHSLKPLLCAADTSNRVCIWNWQRYSCVAAFSIDSSSRRRSTISHLSVVNPLTEQFLLLGSDDAVVRIFNCTAFRTGVESSNCLLSPEEVDRGRVSAFRVLEDETRTGSQPASTVYHWEQQNGLLFASGSVKVVEVWDAAREQKIETLPVDATTGAQVTSISSDDAGTKLVSVGCSDGLVLRFDRRLPANEGKPTTLRDLRRPIVKVHQMPVEFDARSRLIAASDDCQVRVYDPRLFKEPSRSFSMAGGASSRLLESDRLEQSPSSLFVQRPPSAAGPCAVDVQSAAGGLVACSTAEPAVRLRTIEGERLAATIRHHGSAAMGREMAEISCLQFHPRRLVLAVGSGPVASAHGLLPNNNNT